MGQGEQWTQSGSPFPLKERQKIVLALASGYASWKLTPFFSSLRTHSPSARIIIFVEEPGPKLKKLVSRFGAVLIEYDRTYPFFREPRLASLVSDVWANTQLFPSNLRYLLYKVYLDSLPSEMEASVLHTDIRDVIFQSCPFSKLDNNDTLYCFEEDHRFRIEDELATRGWVLHAYGEEGLQSIGREFIVCSGVTLGSKQVFDRYLQVFLPELLSVSASKDYHGVDQGIHNYLLHKGRLPFAKIVPDDEWILTTISYFKPYSKISRNSQGIFLNHSGEPVAIVHQYDRYLSMLWRYNKMAFLEKAWRILKQRLRRDVLNLLPVPARQLLVRLRALTSGSDLTPKM